MAVEPRDEIEDEPRGERHGEPREDHLDWSEEDQEWYNERGRAVCGAKRRKVNTIRKQEMGSSYYPIRCRVTMKMMNGRCKVHAGKTPIAYNSHRTVSGMGSQYVPRGILEKYRRNEADPYLRNLRIENDILLTRIEELLDQIPKRTSSDLWLQCQHVLDEALNAQKNKDLAVVQEKLAELTGLIRTGAGAAETWGEVLKTIEQRRKVQAVENKRIFREENTITHEQALLLVHGVIHACNEVLDKYRVDPNARQEIADALIRLTNSRNIKRTPA